MIVELKMPKSSDSKKESNIKNKPQEQSRSGGLLKNIIKALFNSVVDLPQQEQLNKILIDNKV